MNTSNANVGGTVWSQLNGNVRRGQNVSVTALTTGVVYSDIKAGAAALLAGVTVNVSNASLTTGVDAHIGNGAVITVSGDLKNIAQSQDTATSQGFGISIGALALGADFSTATLAPSITAYVGPNAQVQASSITIASWHNYDQTGPMTNNTAEATAEDPGGGLISVQGRSPHGKREPHARHLREPWGPA